MIAGVDGCKAGWLVAKAEDWPVSVPMRLLICRDFATVLAVTDRCSAVVVDMPIGLPPTGQRRECDRLARERLGNEGRERVFDTPPRALLVSPTFPAFNRSHGQMFGKGTSQQAFALLPKLREVDTLMTPELQTRVREFHPELVWHRLAGRTLPSKHKPVGLRARRKLLRRSIPELVGLLKWRKTAGRACKEDDLLDALAGLELAYRMASNPPSADLLPQNAQCDERGLRMEIWF